MPTGRRIRTTRWRRRRSSGRRPGEDLGVKGLRGRRAALRRVPKAVLKLTRFSSRQYKHAHVHVKVDARPGREFQVCVSQAERVARRPRRVRGERRAGRVGGRRGRGGRRGPPRGRRRAPRRRWSRRRWPRSPRAASPSSARRRTARPVSGAGPSGRRVSALPTMPSSAAWVSPSAPRRSAPCRVAGPAARPAAAAEVGADERRAGEPAPRRSAPASEAPRRRAPARSAPRRSAPSSQAARNSAPARRAPRRSAPSRRAPQRSARGEVGAGEDAPGAWAPRRTAPASRRRRAAPRRAGRPRGSRRRGSRRAGRRRRARRLRGPAACRRRPAPARRRPAPACPSFDPGLASRPSLAQLCAGFTGGNEDGERHLRGGGRTAALAGERARLRRGAPAPRPHRGQGGRLRSGRRPTRPSPSVRRRRCCRPASRWRRRRSSPCASPIRSPDAARPRSAARSMPPGSRPHRRDPRAPRRPAAGRLRRRRGPARALPGGVRRPRARGRGLSPRLRPAEPLLPPRDGPRRPQAGGRTASARPTSTASTTIPRASPSGEAQAETLKAISTGRMSAPLIGIMSCGQADIATMQSISARSDDPVAGPGDRRKPGDAAVGADGDVHPDVEGLRHLRRPRADRGHRHAEVVRAVVVVVGAAEPEVAEEVAGRDQRVVDAGRGVLDQRQDRAAAVGEERVADPRHDPPDAGAGVLPRQVLGRVRGAEGPEVADLGAVGVDDGDASRPPSGAPPGPRARGRCRARPGSGRPSGEIGLVAVALAPRGVALSAGRSWMSARIKAGPPGARLRRA